MQKKLLQLNGPLIGAKLLQHIGLLLFTAVVLCACGTKNQQSTGNGQNPCKKQQPEVNAPVEIRLSLFNHRDSVMYWAQRAYEQNDPKGQFVVGACYYIRMDGHLPDEITTVSRAEADTMLMLSAAQNYQPAIDLIHCLHQNGCWHHEY